MVATIIRTPDERDTAVAFDLPKDLAPHVREWFTELKRDGESLDDFVCRMACNDAVSYVQRVTIANEGRVREDAHLADQLALADEAQALLNGER